MSNPLLPRLSPTIKTGEERFHASGVGAGFALFDFWRWSTSDLVSNATRGVLAEFIVAKALGLRMDCVRMAWDKCDLVTQAGLKVEVKSAAYVQTWAQKSASRISFMVQKRRGWDPETNVQDTEPRRHAAVYVFALLAHGDRSTIDPLDLDQWRFWAVSTSFLDGRTRSQHSITMATLLKLVGEPVAYLGLADAVERAARGGA